ncbi:LLM class F420-dependent oxidoreductase [Actinoplanes lobatus]|uniref:LLM class F420-dependent oxidoreductase n=1 Tax=Actinoplanes lobatus TaxID=113568 RepID=A0A7W7HQW1_9ACTN|nr:TIGR03619 family F420-dependent LLM class oxidoreductase [Actinoplanes lobatus]MBB4755036.1 putative F420-dependent oxidoreductase [Actinoplanes lobatus]GGN82407.1 LLM class F420-dependent oxidoreductase [Actinoplanes lobatus]GIE40646.1 LLM class F420-dependent oxidoreductase [Actinoplanes lobatus]
MVKLGINLPQFRHYSPGPDVIAAARAFEEIGYDSLWAFERLLVPRDQSGPHGLYGVPDLPWPDRYRGVTDPLITLTLAAAVTDRIELASGVLVVPFHAPLQLARALATLDAASGGRVIAGLGTGWSPDEFEAGSPVPRTGRGRALDEFLDIAAAVWGPDPVTYDTGRYRSAPADIAPKPARPIPVLLGGAGEKALARVARRADGWVASGTAPAQVKTTWARIREMAAEVGRDPAALSCTAQIGTLDITESTASPRPPYAGSVAQLAEDVAALAEAGADHIYVTLPAAVDDLKELIDRAAEFHEKARAAL